MKKKILTIIIAVCIFVLPLTVNSFAANNSVKNDAFYVELDSEFETYAYIDTETTFEFEKIGEVEEDYEEFVYDYVYVSVIENTTGIDNVEEDKAELDTFFQSIIDGYIWLMDDNTEFKSEVSEINGYKCIKYFAVDDETYYYTGYLLATEENVYCLLTETDIKNSSFIKTATESFTINGTLLAGDSHKNTVDFTDAENYKTQAQALVNEGNGGLGVMDPDMNAAAKIGFVFLSIPFFVVLILAIVFIVKYSKNKKILEQYEKTFGGMGMGMPPYGMNNQMNYGVPYNNSYMPNQMPMNQPPMNQPPMGQPPMGQPPFDNNNQNNNTF